MSHSIEVTMEVSPEACVEFRKLYEQFKAGEISAQQMLEGQDEAMRKFPFQPSQVS